MNGMTEINRQTDNFTPKEVFQAAGLPQDLYPFYSWVFGDGRNNMANWIEAAARKVNR